MGRPIYERVVAMRLGGLRPDRIHRPGEGTSASGRLVSDPPECLDVPLLVQIALHDFMVPVSWFDPRGRFLVPTAPEAKGASASRGQGWPQATAEGGA
jgi:hypothetical protein